MTTFESRTGSVNESAEKIYAFITDMRNFKRFLPEGKVENWVAGRENCSFEVPPVGKVSLRIISSEEFSVVKYGGDGLNNTEFFLWVQVKELKPGDSRVKITIKAELNPVLKMMASGPLNDFLEKLVKGMETFDDWS